MNASGQAQERQELGSMSNSEADDEPALVDALLAGQESAFVKLLNRYHASMLRLAMVYVRDPAVAEEVVQETWLGVLHGLNRFERRSSIKTWLFRILTNQAKTRGRREARTLPFSALSNERVLSDEQAPDSGDLNLLDYFNQAGHWSSPPRSWDDLPEERLLSKETRAEIYRAIDALPPAQREVITLRDVEGWSAEEVRNVLDVTDTNQRVLLHRARARVRQVLEQYLKPD